MTKIVFFGTPSYVVPVLKKIHKSFKSREKETPISAVVTRRPKPRGRDQLLSYSPVDDWAYKKGVPIYFDSEKLIKDRVIADVGILAAYGEIIPKSVIDYFPKGILNIHPSLLPKYRGASPVQAAIVAGEKETGVAVIKLDEKLDHGPIVSSFSEKIKDDDTTGSLRERLFERSAEFMEELIPAYLSEKVNLKSQDHDKATFTTLLKKDHGFVEPSYIKASLEGKPLDDEWDIGFMKDYTQKPTPESIERFIRAMKPWPQTWTFVNIKNEKKRLKLLDAHIEDGKLMLDTVHLEGKTETSWKQFSEAYGEIEIFE